MDSPLLSLRITSEEHHARLVPHVDRLLTLAEMVGHVDCASIHVAFEEEYAFIVNQLVPHMATIEQSLYVPLEQLMGRRHSMAPMRAEHRAVERLVEELGRYRRHVDGCTWGAVEGMALRRALYRLHAILKVHLAEEELYLGVLERNLTARRRTSWRGASTTPGASRSRSLGRPRRRPPLQIARLELRRRGAPLLHHRRPLVERRRARLGQRVVAARRARARSTSEDGPGPPARGPGASGRPGRCRPRRS